MKDIVVFSILSIILTILAAIESVEGKWCNQTVMIDKVRYVTVPQIVQKRKENAWCRFTKYAGGCTYNAIELISKPEYYKQPTITRECCSGYHQEGTNCLPICSNGCENGYCKEPEFCACNEGYVTLTPFSCQPFCLSCPNGCVDPSAYVLTCKCPDGFVESLDGVCEPFCPDCSNGRCVAPHDCQCNKGYSLTPPHDYPLRCIPVCDNCAHGRCVAPEECQCNEGFFHSTLDGGCQPICDPPCVNGFCEGPNQCSCLDDHDHVNSTHCSPICKNGCPANSYCATPNECRCESGYETHIYDYGMKCEPICNPPCDKNAECQSPGKCVCQEGYSLSPGELQCKPVCDVTCHNDAHCAAPNKCECNQGFRSLNETFCEPICEDECPFAAKCVAPGQCRCITGYLDDQSLGALTCNPICDPPCANGVCVEPNVCHCNTDYMKISDNECVECNCPHGTCLLSECICDEGYDKDGPFSCKFQCPADCHEGCSAPGQCIRTSTNQEVEEDEHLSGTTEGGLEIKRVFNSFSSISDEEEITATILRKRTSSEGTWDSSTEEETWDTSPSNPSSSEESSTIVICPTGGCENEKIVEGSSSDSTTTNDRLQGDSKWYLWLIICGGVISCLLIVALVYAKFIRTKSFDVNEYDNDSRLSVSYHKSSY